MTGIKVIEDFISPQRALRLIERLDNLFGLRNRPGRYVSRFGADNAYGGNLVDRKIPDWLESVIDELVFSDICKAPNHVTINLYVPGGSTIPFHVDNVQSGDTIIILSLAADCTMLLRKTVNRGLKEEVSLPKNSLLILSGEARWDYEHSIAPLNERRYSLVFRKTK